MLVEVLILNRDRCLLQGFGNLIECDERSVLVAVKLIQQHFVGPVIELRRLCADKVA